MADLDDNSIIELTDIADQNLDLSADGEMIDLTDIAENESSDLDLEFEESGLEPESDDLEPESDDLEPEISIQAENEETEEIVLDDFIDPEQRDESLKDSETGDNGLENERDSEIETGPEKSVPGSLNVDREQIEAVLERVIEKKFGDRMDNLISDVMEKILKKQIIELKKSLLKDLDQLDDNVL